MEKKEKKGQNKSQQFLKTLAIIEDEKFETENLL